MVDLYTIAKLAAGTILVLWKMYDVFCEAARDKNSLWILQTTGTKYPFYAPGEWTRAKACRYAEKRFAVPMALRKEYTQTVYVVDEEDDEETEARGWLEDYARLREMSRGRKPKRTNKPLGI